MELGISISFWILAAVSIIAALGVVVLRNVFRAALLLIVCFVGVAGIYVTLSADFLAAVQILVYAGAIAILLLFAIMLTRDVQRGNPSNRLQWSAFVVAILLLATIAFVVLGADWRIAAQVPNTPTTAAIATALFDKEKGFVLPFEIASVLLLAAMIGAIALVREK